MVTSRKLIQLPCTLGWNLKLSLFLLLPQTYSFSSNCVVVSFLNGSRRSSSFSLQERDFTIPASLLYLCGDDRGLYENIVITSPRTSPRHRQTGHGILNPSCSGPLAILWGALIFQGSLVYNCIHIQNISCDVTVMWKEVHVILLVYTELVLQSAF